MGKVTSQNILDGIVVRFDDIVLFEAITQEKKETAEKTAKKAVDEAVGEAVDEDR